ncbi:hypothetical protein ACIGBH_41640 [Streptomyces sp. NPDC085929]|uniref:hypothetical protein n=1 Tax=Streptomyces sp. NPDC085929 TaxID=3365739 RepID=UPI0037D193FC
MKWATFRTVKPYTAQGFPAPISSEGSVVLLWDREQIDAYRDGGPQPALPDVEDGADLLDRREAAAVLGVQPRSFDSYKADDRLAGHAVVVCGLEHWPRAALRAYVATRGTASAPQGRPKGSGDMVPRDLLPGRIAELLDADPAVTAAQAVDVLGVSISTAQKHLLQARAERIAEQMRVNPGLDADQAADRLGFPAAVRRAAVRAARELRNRH